MILEWRRHCGLFFLSLHVYTHPCPAFLPSLSSSFGLLKEIELENVTSWFLQIGFLH